MTETQTTDEIVRATYLAPVLQTGIAFVLGFLTDRWLARRPKLVWFYGHNTGTQIPDPAGVNPPLIVNSHSVSLSNSGRGTAHNVALDHTTLQNIHFQVFPVTEYIREPITGGGGERIRFPRLVAGSTVWINYIAAGVRTDNINVSCSSDEGAAKIVNVGPQRIWPRWLTRFAGVMFYAGVLSSAYWLYCVALYLAHHVTW